MTDTTTDTSPYTPEEAQLIERLRKRHLKDLQKLPDFNTDWNMAGFLSSASWNLHKAESMLKNYLKWRKKHDYSRVQAFDFSPYVKYLEMYYVCGFYNTDRQGRPVLIERMGLSKPKEIVKHTSRAVMINFMIQRFERLVHVILPMCSKAAGRRIDSIVVIYDMKDFNCMTAMDPSVLKHIKTLSKVVQEYYPHLISNFYMVNIPLFFKTVYNGLKYLAKESTRSRIKMFKGPAVKELLELIPEENLPVFLGGKCQEPLQESPGPWREALRRAVEQKSFYLEDREAEFQYYYTEKERQRCEGKSKEKQLELLDEIRTLESDVMEVRVLFRPPRSNGLMASFAATCDN